MEGPGLDNPAELCPLDVGNHMFCVRRDDAVPNQWYRSVNDLEKRMNDVWGGAGGQLWLR